MLFAVLVGGGEVNNRDNWETPDWLVWYASLNFPNGNGFSYDAACTTLNKKAKDGAFHDLGMDGLKESWYGDVWLNPPYSNKREWLKKALHETKSGNCTSVTMLLPCDTSTEFFSLCVETARSVILLNGRVRFKPPEGIKESSNRYASMLVFISPGNSCNPLVFMSAKQQLIIDTFNAIKKIEGEE